MDRRRPAPLTGTAPRPLARPAQIRLSGTAARQPLLKLLIET